MKLPKLVTAAVLLVTLLVLTVGAAAVSSAAGGDNDSSLFRRWQASDPWTLPQPCLLQRMGIQTGGWLQAGITANGEDPAGRFNGPALMNDLDGELQLHQLWLYFERPCDTGGSGFDIGGRFDMFYGTDWRVGLCFGHGLEDEINGLDQLYGLSLPQWYVELGLNKLSVKVGRMAGILGYETVPPMGNFFYSRSYLKCYTEPLLITGLMAEYPLTDRLSVLAGFHQGFTRVTNNNDKYAFEGGLAWKSLDQRTSLAFAVDTGKIDDAGLINQYIHSIVFTREINRRTHYALEAKQGYLDGAGVTPNADWYGIAQYLIREINPHWSAGMRIEWFRDEDGTRVLGLGNLPNADGWLGAPGYAGSFTELSLGLNWKPKPNIICRPEVRWDWYDGAPNPNGPDPLPFDDGASPSQFTFATDLVVMF